MNTLDSLQMVEDESSAAFAAFREYLMMGVKRSLLKTAKRTGASLVAVEGWSTKFKWGDRVKLYEQELTNAFVSSKIDLMKQNKDQITEDMLADYQDMLQLWRGELDKIRAQAEDVEDGEPKNLDVKDIRLLIQARQLIDDMGRRSVGLPNTVARPTEDNKSQLPTGIILPQLGGSTNDSET